MLFDRESYLPGRRSLQIDGDCRIALAAFRALIAADEALSAPGFAGDTSLTVARDSLRASAADDFQAHLRTLAEVADEDGDALGADCHAAADRLQQLYDMTDAAKRIRDHAAAEARFKAVAEVVRPLGTKIAAPVAVPAMVE